MREPTRQLKQTGCETIDVEGGFYAVLRCEDWNRNHGFASSKELARMPPGGSVILSAYLEQR